MWRSLASALATAVHRLLHPRRTIWPTRDGWWCLFAAVGLGVAAVNTGNNLLYLLSAMLLGLVVMSGVLSEAVMRGLRLRPIVPDEIYAGRPFVLGAGVANRKIRVPSYSLTLEVLAAGKAERTLYLPRVGPGEEQVVAWEAVLPRRGRRRLGGLRVTTLFPFGVFVKAARPVLDAEVLVFPAVGPAPAHLLRQLNGAGSARARRRGRGHDLHNLRDYQPGDDPRLIHWRSSARTQVLTVREMEAEVSVDARIVLEGRGRAEPARLEQAIADAASLAVHLLRGGAGVELVGPAVHVPLGHGPGQARRVLTALAELAPGEGAAEPAPRARTALREIRVDLGA